MFYNLWVRYSYNTAHAANQKMVYIKDHFNDPFCFITAGNVINLL